MSNQCIKFYITSLYSSRKISNILYGDTFLARPVYMCTLQPKINSLTCFQATQTSAQTTPTVLLPWYCVQQARSYICIVAGGKSR